MQASPAYRVPSITYSTIERHRVARFVD
ncbi:hypothetical protein GN958_ATG14486 [Phytophthora infestans]|uniref:Uncharacterized protein n=1 Tax=Phytophthora infestans TaxID=4787 RepID=A0A8S9UBH9_PHYIN|nr:hypothetical protein GN958_ATG14486 [Phytophthora infestans]